MKKEYSDYIVSLPLLKFPNLKNVRALEIVVSTSDRGAVSHALAHKIVPKLDRESKSKTIRYAMHQLDADFNGAGNYAFEIQTDFTANEVKVSQLDPIYRIIQESFLAEEIVKKREKKENPRDFLKIAKSYLNFYNTHIPTNQ